MSGKQDRAAKNILERFHFLDTIETVEVHPAGTTLIREDEPGDCMYIIKWGAVEVTYKDQLLDVLEGGELFGEMSAVDENDRSATIVTATECELIRLDQDQVQSLIQENYDLFKFIMSVVSQRLRRMNGIAAMHASAVRDTALAQAKRERRAETPRSGKTGSNSGDAARWEDPSKKPKSEMKWD